MDPEEYAHALNAQLTYLIEFCRAINELDLAGALFGEFRGAQDAGWNTTQTAVEVFGELQALVAREGPLSIAELRQVLSLYSQLSEAGGVYEGLANLMGVVQLKPYSMWPFQDLVRVRGAPRRVIGPNANAMFRNLAETARAIGMNRLSSLLEMTFRDDIRNGICHADYILSQQGLRLRRRNGGHPLAIDLRQLSSDVTVAMTFFDLLLNRQAGARESYRPAKRINGRFSANPPMDWTVELSPDGHFSIHSDSPGVRRDAAYMRQQAINDLLGGRVFAVYVVGNQVVRDHLIEQVNALGFEPLIVEMESEDHLHNLRAEIDAGGLWVEGPHQADGALLIATPFGFSEIVDLEAFQALLPPVDPIVFVPA